MSSELVYTSPDETPSNIRSLTLKGFAQAQGSQWKHLGRMRNEFNNAWQEMALEQMKLIVDQAMLRRLFQFSP